MDIVPEVKIYDFNALKTDKGYRNPSVTGTKKHYPAYSQSKAP